MTDTTRSFFDGCHRYGWILNLIIMGIMFAYFTGGLNQSMVDLRADVNTLKQEVFSLSNITRGLTK
jgi:hypothetical protein